MGLNYCVLPYQNALGSDDDVCYHSSIFFSSQGFCNSLFCLCHSPFPISSLFFPGSSTSLSWIHPIDHWSSWAFSYHLSEIGNLSAIFQWFSSHAHRSSILRLPIWNPFLLFHSLNWRQSAPLPFSILGCPNTRWTLHTQCAVNQSLSGLKPLIKTTTFINQHE